MKRKVYKPTEKLLQPTLTGMRDTVYGKSMQQHIHAVCDRPLSEQGEISKIQAAFDKRARRAAKFKKDITNGKADSK